MHIEWPASVLKSLLLFNAAEGNKTFLSASECFEPPLSETPSTKPQAPEKFQIPNPNPQPDSGANGRRFVLSLELGIWSLLSGLLGFSKIEMLPFSTPDGPARLLRPSLTGTLCPHA